MKTKVIRMTPDQLNYKDRGKMKWQGLILSDHTDAIKKMNQKDAKDDPAPKEKMSIEAISEILQLSYLDKLPIVMQANSVTNGHYYDSLKCLVLGHYETKIYLKLIDGRQVNCELSQIRNVEFMDPLEWYGKK